MKNRKSFNIIDIVIILSLLAVIGAAVFGFVSGIGAVGEKAVIRYVLEVDPIDSELCAKVSVGDGVYSYDDSQRIGTVYAVSTAQAYHTGTDSQGSAVSSPLEGKSVLYVTVEAEAMVSEKGYTVGTQLINAGKKIDIRYPNLFCSSTCVSVEIAK